MSGNKGWRRQNQIRQDQIRQNRPALALALLSLLAISLAAQTVAETTLDQATLAYQQGDLTGAEKILTILTASQPGDLRAAVLMGAVLDRQKRYGEAEVYLTRALQIAPGSAQVLNNFGNHYLAAGDRAHARTMYERAVASNPHQLNANLQLAQMSVDDRQGQSALSYLGRVIDGDSAQEPEVVLLRSRALAICGRCSEAKAILQRLGPSGPASLQFSAGMALAECKLYAAAEDSFSRALKEDPQSFEILYNLGLSASRASDYQRAASVLQTAVKQRPDDGDALFALAQVLLKTGRISQAATLLDKMRKTCPDRADVALLLAQVLVQTESYDDAAAAYSRYLQLRPNEDSARRERGFAFAHAHKAPEAINDLKWYVARHPRDATGYFELAAANISISRPAAVELLNKALTLDPQFYQARYTRGALNLEEGKPRDAIPDLTLYLRHDPKNVRALDRLGEAYLAAGRSGEAVEVFGRARQLAPDSKLILIDYARTLQKLGRKEEADRELLTLNQETGQHREDSLRTAGLTNYVDPSSASQRSRYLISLRENSAAEPENVRLRVALARELFAQGDKPEALTILQQLPPSSLDAALQAECGRLLLDFEVYDKAIPYLQAAVATSVNPAAMRIDLAIALFNSRGTEPALAELDKTASGDRSGDYYLMRAELLDAQGKFPEAAAALNQGMRAAPTRASLYYEAAGFLLKHQLYAEAKTLLEQASRILPDDRELQLAQVVTLHMLRRDPEADDLLEKVRSRWPEWARVYLLKGILLEIALKSESARQSLDTAIALGADTPDAYYYKALANTNVTPADLNAASAAIGRALALNSQDPYICLLAGKISLERKEYPAAIERLQQAVHLAPTLIPAHYALRHAYSDLGEEAKSAAELETIKQLAKAAGGSEETPFSAQDFLFAVRRPE